MAGKKPISTGKKGRPIGGYRHSEFNSDDAIPIHEVPHNECPKCKRPALKNGIRLGKQRYICKKCKDLTFYERGLVLSRIMMARQVVVLMLLGKPQWYIADKLGISERTIVKYLNEYTNFEKFKNLIPQPYERTNDTYLVDVEDVPPLKMNVLRKWRDKKPKQGELLDTGKKTKKASR